MPDQQLDVAVRAVVARQLRLQPDTVTDELDLRCDLAVDDERGYRLLNAIGHALDVSFPDDFLDGIHTYADLSTAVRVSLGP